MVKLVMFNIVMYQFLTFPVCGLSNLTGSLFHFLQGFACSIVLNDHVLGCPGYITSHGTVWLATRHNMSGVSFRAWLDDSTLHTFLSPAILQCTYLFVCYDGTNAWSCSTDFASMKISSKHPVPFLIYLEVLLCCYWCTAYVLHCTY